MPRGTAGCPSKKDNVFKSKKLVRPSLGAGLYYLKEDVTIAGPSPFTTRGLSEVINDDSPVSNSGSVFTALRDTKILIGTSHEVTVNAGVAAPELLKIYSVSRLAQGSSVSKELSNHSRTRNMILQKHFGPQDKVDSMQGVDTNSIQLSLKKGDKFTVEFNLYTVSFDTITSVAGVERSSVQITELARSASGLTYKGDSNG